MKQWLIIDEATSLIVGWQRTELKLIDEENQIFEAMPLPSSGIKFLERDEVKMKEYFDLSRLEIIDRRKNSIVENDGVLSQTVDERPYLEITADKLEVVADGLDLITFTVNTLDDQGKPSIFNGTYNFPFNEKIYKLDFIVGVATFEHVFDKSGKALIGSTPDFKVKDQIILTAVEA